MALLDQIFAPGVDVLAALKRPGGLGLPPGGFFDPTAFSTPVGGFAALDAANAGAPDVGTPQDEAQAAREAAALRLQRATKRPFGFDAKPLPFVDSVAGILSGAGAGAPQTDLPPSTNDPSAAEPQVFAGDVPLPRPKPIDPNAPAASAPLSLAPPAPALAPEAANAQASAAPDAAAPGAGGPLGGLGRLLGNVLKPDNAPLLLALGAGFSGAPSFGTGMQRAFSAAGPAVAQSRALALKNTGIAATYRALIARGVKPADALAAVYNPEVMKSLSTRLFETKPLQHVSIKGPLGDETPMVFDPNRGIYRDAAGNEIKPGANGGLPAAGAPSALLAPGVTFNPEATGDDYLNQFNKDVKAAVHAYINGDVMPTGNARQKSLTTFAKHIAQRYGQDMGIPVSDATYAAKRKFFNDYGSSQPSTIGGQVKGFQQGIHHLETLVDHALDYGPSGGLGIPSVAHGMNAIRQGASTSEKGKASRVGNDAQLVAGEAMKLFSGSQGGGVHERQAITDRFGQTLSGPELAGAAESTLDLMMGGLHTLEGRRDQILGPNNNVKFLSPEDQARIERIREKIKRLQGDSTGAAAPAPVVPQLAPGQATTINGVTIKRVH